MLVVGAYSRQTFLLSAIARTDEHQDKAGMMMMTLNWLKTLVILMCVCPVDAQCSTTGSRQSTTSLRHQSSYVGPRRRQT